MTPTSSGPISPEKQLLVCCARTSADPPIRDEIRRLCAAPLDWDWLVEQSATNSILPLVARQIAAAANDVAPAKVVERLAKAARANAWHCLSLTAELIKVTDLLSREGVQSMPYKGPVLAVQAYGDVAVREFEDLDIVVRQRDMVKVNEVLKRLGYRANYPWRFDSGASSAVVPGEYDYRDDNRGMVIEFHTEFTLRHFPVKPDLEEMSSQLVPVMLSGHEIRAFAPEDVLMLLCVHGSKDFWERISWVADISELVRAYPRLDWDIVFRRSEALRAGRMLHVGLALASKLLNARVPEAVAARARRDLVAQAVASEIAQRHLRREGHQRGALERFHFRRRMVAGTLAGWQYSMRLTTQPADEDSSALRLPRPLAPLYAVLRPLRLFRQYRPSDRSSVGPF